MRQNEYQKLHCEIADMMSSYKNKNHARDRDVGNLIGLSASHIGKLRGTGTLPTMDFDKLYVLAQAAGYRIRIEKVSN